MISIWIKLQHHTMYIHGTIHMHLQPVLPHHRDKICAPLHVVLGQRRTVQAQSQRRIFANLRHLFQHPLQSLSVHVQHHS